MISKFKSNQNFHYTRCVTPKCIRNKLSGYISASLLQGNTAPFEKMSQRWRAVGNTVSNLTVPKFESQTSRSRDECVPARTTGW